MKQPCCFCNMYKPVHNLVARPPDQWDIALPVSNAGGLCCTKCFARNADQATSNRQEHGLFAARDIKVARPRPAAVHA